MLLFLNQGNNPSGATSSGVSHTGDNRYQNSGDLTVDYLPPYLFNLAASQVGLHINLHVFRKIASGDTIILCLKT